MKRLIEWRDSTIDSATDPELITALKTIGVQPRRPLGRFNIWAWWVELVRGCNLRCAFCPTRLFPRGMVLPMDEQVWVDFMHIVAELTPHARIEFCNAGEPLLHPRVLDFLREARGIAPNVQIMTYTNGTTLIDGSLTYKQLFEAGLNCLHVDMYHPTVEHAKLAEASGATWFHQDQKPKNCPSVFTNHDDPSTRLIMLAENPYNWSKRKISRGYLQTFFNDLDWKAASAWGMKPVETPPNRRCDLPMKFANVNYDGTYIFCCFDYLRHTANLFSNVSNGLEGFMQFWFGEYMQRTRRVLRTTHREQHEWCRKCSFTSIRCDIPFWDAGMQAQYYTNDKRWEDAT